MEVETTEINNEVVVQEVPAGQVTVSGEDETPSTLNITEESPTVTVSESEITVQVVEDVVPQVVVADADTPVEITEEEIGVISVTSIGPQGAQGPSGVGVFRTSHTFAVMGIIETGNSTPSFFIAGSQGQSTSAVKVRYKIAEGTSLTFKIQKNSQDWIGTTGSPLTATTSVAETTNTDALAENDEIDVVILTATDSPKDFTASLILEHTVP